MMRLMDPSILALGVINDDGDFRFGGSISESIHAQIVGLCEHDWKES